MSADPEPLIRQTAEGQWLLLTPSATMVTADWFQRDHWAGTAHELSDGGRAAPWLLQTELGALVWRHYRRGGLLGRWLDDRYLWNGLRRSRPWQEFVCLQRLQQAGMPVPPVIAAQVQRSGRWYRADLLTGWIEGSCSLASHLRSGSLPTAQWRALGALIARLHERGCEHADLNAHNILLDECGRFWLIDFDRARWRESSARGRSWGQANLARLQRSLSKLQLTPAADDWAALQQGYAGP